MHCTCVILFARRTITAVCHLWNYKRRSHERQVGYIDELHYNTTFYLFSYRAAVAVFPFSQYTILLQSTIAELRFLKFM